MPETRVPLLAAPTPSATEVYASVLVVGAVPQRTPMDPWVLRAGQSADETARQRGLVCGSFVCSDMSLLCRLCNRSTLRPRRPKVACRSTCIAANACWFRSNDDLRDSRRPWGHDKVGFVPIGSVLGSSRGVVKCLTYDTAEVVLRPHC